MLHTIASNYDVNPATNIIRFFDLNRDTPELTGSIVNADDIPSSWAAMDRVGPISYFLRHDGTLSAVDFSNPSAPILLGSKVVAKEGYQNIAVHGNKAFLARRSGVDVMDISDPTKMTQIGDIDFDLGFAAGLEILGTDLVILTDESLLTFDISDPGSPQLNVHSLNATASFQPSLAVAGNHAFVGALDGLVVYDLTDPTRPLRVAHREVPGGQVRDIAVSSNTAYIVGPNGLFAFDVTEPAAPVLVGTSSIATGAEILVDDALVVVRGQNAVRVFENTSHPADAGQETLRVEILPFASGDGIPLRVHGPSGSHAILERSHDLRVWEPFQGIQINGHATRLVDDNGAGTSSCYYRARPTNR